MLGNVLEDKIFTVKIFEYFDRVPGTWDSVLISFFLFVWSCVPLSVCRSVDQSVGRSGMGGLRDRLGDWGLGIRD